MCQIVSEGMRRRPANRMRRNGTVARIVLNHTADTQDPDADATITLNRTLLNAILLGEVTIEEYIENGGVHVEGSRVKVIEFFLLLDKFEFWFNIVTP